MTSEAQKRASKKWHAQNKEHCYDLTKKWREENLELWREKTNEYAKKYYHRRRAFTLEVRRLLDINI